MMEKFEKKDIADQVERGSTDVNVKLSDLNNRVDSILGDEEKKIEQAAIAAAEKEMQRQERLPNLEVSSNAIDTAKVEVSPDTIKENTPTDGTVALSKSNSVQSRIQELVPNSPANQGRELSYNQVSSFVSTLPTGLANFFADV